MILTRMKLERGGTRSGKVPEIDLNGTLPTRLQM